MKPLPRLPTLIVGSVLASIFIGISWRDDSYLPALLVGASIVFASVAYGKPRRKKEELGLAGINTRSYVADSTLLSMHRHRMSLKLSNMEIDRELQRSVFQVASELLGCREEKETLKRFKNAISSYWDNSGVDLLIWEKGTWRSFGTSNKEFKGQIPSLDKPIQLPTPDINKMIFDLSPAVEGQAALIIKNPKKQIILKYRSDFDDNYLAEILRGQLTLSLRRYFSYAALQELGRVDPLTDTWRRWYGQERLDELMRDETLLSLAMIDIDYFKNVNDQFGHAAGDKVLRAVGKMITKTIRTGDIAFRYGGEEFCVLLPETSPTGSKQVAERMRQAIASLPDLPSAVTVSIGVASCHKEESAESFLQRADQALYEAKESGRNKVINADESTLAHRLRSMRKLVRNETTTGSIHRKDFS